MSDKVSKELGYVELEWTCPTCKTRNPGTQKLCSGCGAAQPKDVKFETPGQAELIQDKDKIAQAKAGPDIHCGFCGARNPGNAKICHQCGADLTQGKARETGAVVGAFDTSAPKEVKCAACGMMNKASAKTCTRCGAPLGKPAAAAAPTPTPMPAAAGSGGMTWIFLVIAAIIVVGAIAFVMMGLRTNAKTVTVSDARWERSIQIIAPMPVSSSAWADQVPANAANLSCRQEFRYTSSQPVEGSREVCGTPYTIDTGTGLGRVVQDCEYEVYDDMCRFTTMQLGVINTVVAQGSALQANSLAPKWPVANLQANQQLGDRQEEYVCIFRGDGDEYSFTVRTLAEYEECQPGSQWQLEVNSFGSVVSAEPAN